MRSAASLDLGDVALVVVGVPAIAVRNAHWADQLGRSLLQVDDLFVGLVLNVGADLILLALGGAHDLMDLVISPTTGCSDVADNAARTVYMQVPVCRRSVAVRRGYLVPNTSSIKETLGAEGSCVSGSGGSSRNLKSGREVKHSASICFFGSSRP